LSRTVALPQSPPCVGFERWFLGGDWRQCFVLTFFFIRPSFPSAEFFKFWSGKTPGAFVRPKFLLLFLKFFRGRHFRFSIQADFTFYLFCRRVGCRVGLYFISASIISFYYLFEVMVGNLIRCSHLLYQYPHVFPLNSVSFEYAGYFSPASFVISISILSFFIANSWSFGKYGQLSDG